MITRQSISKKGEKQIIAANVDAALIIQAADRDFNINRIERYLTICHESQIDPIVVLNKTDLLEENELREMLEPVTQRIPDVPVFAISNASGEGIDRLEKIIQKGKTYCLLGSSGVGKSTLVNTLCSEEVMKTNAISAHSDRGRHVTTHRELRILKQGAMLIDNPGMREVGIADASAGLEMTFDALLDYAVSCKFKDCTHTSETGCAVLEALEAGEIDPSIYENYQKMAREKEHFESTVAEKRKKDKVIGKILKNYKKGNYKQR
jgi:ribosome biogenesis GTPase